jgi:hypothetical protein
MSTFSKKVWEFFPGKRADECLPNLAARKRVPSSTKYIFSNNSDRPDVAQCPVEHWPFKEIFEKFQGGPRLSHAHQIWWSPRRSGPAWEWQILCPAHFRFPRYRTLNISFFGVNFGVRWGVPLPIIVDFSRTFTPGLSICCHGKRQIENLSGRSTSK